MDIFKEAEYKAKIESDLIHTRNENFKLNEQIKELNKTINKLEAEKQTLQEKINELEHKYCIKLIKERS